MHSEVKRGVLIGVVCALIGGLGYYITDPDVLKALFVGGIGLVVGLLIFVIMKFAGGRESARETTEHQS